MKAELISTGTELLLGQIINTNAQFLAERLAQIGIDVYFQTTVGDNESRIQEAFSSAMGRSDLIIITGGLGPTSDDLTKEAVASALDLEMYLDQKALSRIESFFDFLGKKMPEINRKQALIPAGAHVMLNRQGTAPGVIIENQAKTIILLPGPPIEMKPMFIEQVEPFLIDKAGSAGSVIVSRTLKILGIGESSVEELINDLVDQQSNPTVAFLAPQGEVYVRITAKAHDKGEAYLKISEVEKGVRNRLGVSVYGTDDETLEEVVVGLLNRHGLTLVLAESCTGGLISKRLTDIPGVSENFPVGIVTYSNETKINFLGVSTETLANYGAVSEATALEMARGAKLNTKADLALSVTGIAGPGGGTPDKPVGLVYIGFTDGKTDIVKKLQFTGDRQVVRWQSANAALNLLRKHLLQYKT